jgi:hypothetical protein
LEVEEMVVLELESETAGRVRVYRGQAADQSFRAIVEERGGKACRVDYLLGFEVGGLRGFIDRVFFPYGGNGKWICGGDLFVDLERKGKRIHPTELTQYEKKAGGKKIGSLMKGLSNAARPSGLARHPT